MDGAKGAARKQIGSVEGPRTDLQETPRKQRSDLSHDGPLAPGLAHTKTAPDPEVRTTAMHDAARQADLLPYLRGKDVVSAEIFAKITGIEVDDAEAAALDAKVKAVAERIGIDHQVRFAPEQSYMNLYDFAFLGSVEGANRPEQPLLVGVGVKAQSVDEIDLLTRFWNREPTPEGLRPWLEDFLSLSEEERIEAILVHEKHEIDAINDGTPKAHHVSVARSADTPYRVSPRVREHLKLYAEVNRAVFGVNP